jgi:hypothetical protein
VLPVSASATMDSTLGSIWDSVSASKNFHLLDNASAMTFKSIKANKWYTGVGTMVYQYSYLDLDFLAIRTIDTRSSIIPGAGITIQAGRFLYERVGFIKEIVDRAQKTAPMINNATLGIGYSRNFSTGEDIPYVYGGIVAKWGSVK